MLPLALSTAGLLGLGAAPASAAPQPRLSVTQVVSPSTYDHAGQVLSWTSVVSNTGDTPLVGLAVTDASSRLSARTCAPVAVGGSLAAGASTTCRATLTVTQDDVDTGASRTDAVTATARTSTGTTVNASATATATSTATLAPGLSLTATTNATTLTRVGQRVGYTVVARNKGNVTLRDLLVTDPAAGLSALVCAPVPLGGQLDPGATTTCRAGRTTTAQDVAASALSDTVKATARTRTTAVNAATTVRVAVSTRPPVATDDHVSVVDEGGPALLEGSANDHPARPDGPAIDPSRTVLVGTGVSRRGKQLYVNGETWSVRDDGRVQVDLLSYTPSHNASVQYRAVDVAGRSATGTLTLTVVRRATGAADQAVTEQGRPVTTDVLANDDPGQGTGASTPTLDRSSLRLTGLAAGGPAYATVAPDGRTVTVPFVGTYAVGDAGTVTFTPVPAFSGDTTVQYAAHSSNGSTDTGNLHVSVVPVAVHPETLVTTAGKAVTFPAPADHPIPGAAVLVAPGADADGTTLVTGAGTWTVRPDGSVAMVPAPGYDGSTSVRYAAVGGLRPAPSITLTLTVRPGPTAEPVEAVTPAGRAVTLAPLAVDAPGQRLDGSVAAFVPASLTLLTTGLPPGSALSDGGRTLTVPGQGVWTVDATTGAVRFVPAGSFVGQASLVTYVVRADSSSLVRGRLQVAVTGSAPVATDDFSATPQGVAVELPGAVDDQAGSTPLRPALTVFPTDGQPAGSSRSDDGKTLSVQGQGTWTVDTDGTVTFTPVPGFVGTAAAVAYTVTDTAGASARATLSVVVRPGPTARPDAVRLGLPVGNAVDAPVADDDVPGRNADGSLGTIDPTSVQLPGSGQDSGWTVRTEGTFLQYAAGGAVIFARVDPVTGVVHLNQVTAGGARTLALRYTVRDTVTDATGALVHRTVSSVLTIDVLSPHPVATDDHAFTASPYDVYLPAIANDVPSDPSIAIYPDGSFPTFPTSQLASLPPGSVIKNAHYPADTITVPGEGVWSRLAHEGGQVVFAPDPGFLGTTTPVRYTVVDRTYAAAEGTLQVTVRRGATTHDDTAHTPRGVPTTVDVLANDDPGLNADGSRASFDRTNVSLGDLPPGSTHSIEGDQATVPGQGSWVVQPATGTIRFTPDPGFVGTASLRYTVYAVADIGTVAPQGRYVDGALQVVVDPVTPTARPDTASTTVGHPVVVPVLHDDAAGDPAVPLVGSSVRLRTAPGLPAGSVLSGDAKQLVVAGRGTFLVAGDGEITFVPLGTSTGAVPTVGYSVADANGTTARSTLTVSVRQA